MWLREETDKWLTLVNTHKLGEVSSLADEVFLWRLMSGILVTQCDVKTPNVSE
jgi:hypothetical protein